MPRTSKIWDYFTVSPGDNTRAKCHICSSLISRGGKTTTTFNTSNLKNHLRSCHGISYQEFEVAQKEANDKKRKAEEQRHVDGQSTSQNAKRVHQMTLAAVVDKMTPWPKSDSRTIAANSKLAEMVPLDLQPFAITSNVGFQRFCHLLQPRYTLPSNKHISQTLIPDMYERVKAKVKEELSNVDHVAFTTDIWSSTCSANSLLSLTGHWIGEDFVRKHGVLNASSFVGQHTAEAIKNEINRMLTAWNLEKKAVTILRDNAANAVAGLELTGVDHQGCFVHTLQLVIHDAISTQRSVNDMLAICRRIAGHFNRSPLAHHRLKILQEKHNMPKHHIIQDVSTRWNSSFYMLQRILEQKNAVVEYASLYDIPIMAANQWKLASTLVSTLKRFEELTRKASSASESTSMVIPSVSMLQRSLRNHTDDQGIQTLTSTMLESLNRRFEEMESNKLLVLSTFLDPRFKTVFFSSANTRQTAIGWLTEEASMNVATPGTLVPAEPADTPDNTKPKHLFQDEYEELLMEKGASATPRVDERDLQQEIDLFLADPLQHRDCDPLSWWKVHSNRFAHLSKFVKKYLCAPPSSVPSERLFSEAGDLYDEKRNRLNPDKAEMILVIRGNLPLLEFKY